MMNPTLPVLVFPLCKLTHWIGNTTCEPEWFIFIYLCHSYLKHLAIFIKWLGARQGNKGTFVKGLLVAVVLLLIKYLKIHYSVQAVKNEARTTAF